jgi:hypothetical protein
MLERGREEGGAHAGDAAAREAWPGARRRECLGCPVRASWQVLDWPRAPATAPGIAARARTRRKNRGDFRLGNGGA